jgi:hypothetical protein
LRSPAVPQHVPCNGFELIPRSRVPARVPLGAPFFHLQVLICRTLCGCSGECSGWASLCALGASSQSFVLLVSGFQLFRIDLSCRLDRSEIPFTAEGDTTYPGIHQLG